MENFEYLEDPGVAADLFDAAIQPLRLLTVAILRTGIVQDLDVGVHRLVDDLVGSVQ